MFRDSIGKAIKLVRIYLLLCALLAGLIGCAGRTEPPLNSERIQDRFGSYGVRVLKQESPWRISCLYSREEPVDICRTVAVVRFAEGVPNALQEPLRKVRDGASLGATLAAAGFRVSKSNVEFAALAADSPGYAGLLSLFDLPEPSKRPNLAAHVYDLHASRDGLRIPVARLFEVHHPDYLSPGDPERIYAGLPDSPEANSGRIDWLAELATVTGQN